jgi:hypothetical protein
VTEIPPATSPSNHIEGLTLRYTNTNEVTLDVGEAYIPSTDEVLTVTTPIVKTVPNAANGLYYAYLYKNVSTPDLEISTTAPAANYFGTASHKSGDNSRRYLGMLRNRDTGALLAFECEDLGGNTVFYHYTNNAVADYLTAIEGGADPTQVAAIGPSATTAAKRLVSPKARMVWLAGYILGSGGPIGHVGCGPGTSGAQIPVEGARTMFFWTRMSPSQELEWYTVPNTANIQIYVNGYYERR